MYKKEKYSSSNVFQDYWNYCSLTLSLINWRTRITYIRYLIARFFRIELKSLSLLYIYCFSFILDWKRNFIGFPPEKTFSRLSLFFPTLRARRGMACAGRSIYQARQFMVEAAWSLSQSSEGGRSNLRPPRKWSVLKRAERVGQFMTRN